MAKTTITAQAIPAAYTKSATDNLVFTACDTSNGNQVQSTKDLLMLVFNDAATSSTVTITGGAVQPYGTIDNIVVTLDADEETSMCRISQVGYRQTDGYIYVTGSDATIKVAFIEL